MIFALETATFSEDFVPSVAPEILEEIHGFSGDDYDDETDATEDQPEDDSQAEEISQDDAPAAVVDTAVAPSVDESSWWEEIQLLAKISEAIREKHKAESEVNAIKEELKEAKENLKLKTALCDKIESDLIALIEGKVIPKPPAKPIAVSQEAATLADQSLADPVDESWRIHSTAEIFAGVKGLGKKKLEALVDLAPTLGALVDLHAEAGLAHKTFKEVLPAGFGEKMCDSIEDAISKFVLRPTSPGGMSCAEQVKLNQSVKQAGQQKPVEAKQEIQPTKKDAAEWSMTLDEVKKQIKETRAEAEELDWTIEECTYHDDDNSVHEETLAGYDHFFEPASQYWQFPSHFSPTQIERWIDGWVAAERRQQLLAEDGQDESEEADDVL